MRKTARTVWMSWRWPRCAEEKKICRQGGLQEILFAVTVYLIYVGMLIAIHGGIASLHGLGASAQTFWFECLHNFSVGTALLVVFLCGLAGALVMANLVMLLSIKIKIQRLLRFWGLLQWF